MFRQNKIVLPLFLKAQTLLQPNLLFSTKKPQKKRRSCEEPLCTDNIRNVQPTKGVKRKSPSFSISTLSLADRKKVLDFLRVSFFVDEPMMQALGTSGSEELEHHCLEPLNEGISLLAADPNSRPLALAVNATTIPGDGERLLKVALACKCQKAKALLKFWADMEIQSMIWQRLDVSHMWEVRILATSFSARSYGLAKMLLERSVNMAREQGYPLVRVDCTSDYSAKAAENYDFYCLHQMNYKDYIGPNGTPVFPTSGPHQAHKIYVLPLIDTRDAFVNATNSKTNLSHK